MKKIVLGIVTILLLSGCGEKMFNTPTKKVEMFFQNYQTLSKDVVEQLNKVVNEEENFNADQRLAYKELMKKHYQELTYEIKDEKIDGNKATVTVEIEVTDYSKTLKDADKYLENNKAEFYDDKGVYNAFLFTTYRIEQLKKVTDKVKFTLNLTLSKVDDEWQLDPISDVDEQKINGVYYIKIGRKYVYPFYTYFFV